MPQLSVPAVGKWIFAFLVAQWVAVPDASRAMMEALVSLMAMDYVTGLSAAYTNKTLAYQIGARGLVKKGLMILLLMTAHIVERISGIELHLEFAGALGFAINEAISIVQNCAECGIWVPSSLVEALITVKKLKGTGATPEQLAALRGDTMGKLYVAGGTDKQMAQLRKDQAAGTSDESNATN